MLALNTPPTAETLLCVLAIVILVGPFLAAKLHLPATIGYVLGGAIVGPLGLGWLAEGEMDALGDIGLLYLMFMAGLELDLVLFARFRGAAIRFGIFTFLAPFLLGVAAGVALDYSRASSILLGSIFASYTLVALPEVKAAGLMGNRAAAIGVSATALTDTLALVILAVITSGAADEPSGSPIISLSVGLVVLAVYCFVVLPRLGRWIFTTIAIERTSRFVFLLLAFSSAGLIADSFGIEGLVGAFLAGLGVNRLVPASGPLMERVEFMGSALFIPAFLVFVGTQLDLEALASVDTLRLSAIFIGALVLGKIIAALITGRLEGFTRMETWLLASLSIGQAAATLAATLVGASVGLFDDDVVNAVLVTVLVTILISSIGTARAAARIEPERSVQKPLGSRVLIGVTPAGADASILQLAASLARPTGGEVIPARVIESAADRAAARADIEAAEREVTAAGADVDGVMRVDSSPIDGLLAVVDEVEPTVLVLQATRSTMTSRLFGRVSDEIGRRCPVPLLVGQIDGPSVERLVLVADAATSGSVRVPDVETAASVAALMLASTGGVPVVVVVDRPSRLDGITLPDEHTVWSTADRPDWPAQLLPGDLVIVASALHPDSPVVAAKERSVIVVSAPYRSPPRTAGFRPSAASLLGYGAIER